ncbi:hypothetical protein UR09_06560 [Candidatus Nitromaritima sp. SCGC AAA799-A02]|nr:hypothetical protein UR09_06560 [Candidatus Nitromaritima sp. SCGC AAA799-A02]
MMKILPKEELSEKAIAQFLADLNELMSRHNLLVVGNAGINIRRLPKNFHGYMAEKWAGGDGFDLRQINKKLIYPASPVSARKLNA